MPARLDAQIADAEGKRRYVRALFATIADRYDLITVLLSWGRDRHWKRWLVDLAAAPSGAEALDLATGTGDIAFALAGRHLRVVGLDVTWRMIELAQRKSTAREARIDSASEASGSDATPVRFVVGDMAALPFAGSSFDLVTTGYGLRNVADLAGAIHEIRRVLRPGGQILSLDFNRPRNPIVRAAYLSYLEIVGGLLGWALHRDPDTYRYIPASIRSYPGAAGVARALEAHGFARVKYYPVLGGLMSIHHGYKV